MASRENCSRDWKRKLSFLSSCALALIIQILQAKHDPQLQHPDPAAADRFTKEELPAAQRGLADSTAGHRLVPSQPRWAEHPGLYFCDCSQQMDSKHAARGMDMLNQKVLFLSDFWRNGLFSPLNDISKVTRSGRAGRTCCHMPAAPPPGGHQSQPRRCTGPRFGMKQDGRAHRCHRGTTCDIAQCPATRTRHSSSAHHHRPQHSQSKRNRRRIIFKGKASKHPLKLVQD